MAVLIEGGEVYSPAPLGRGSLLLVGGRIAAMGEVDRRAAERLWPDLDVVDAAGRIVAPGLVDPHEHLIGGSGERGFATQTPAIGLGEIVTAGITTVVGVLGTDTMTRTMAALLARVKGLTEDGLTAYAWTGGYTVPPATVTGSAGDDILFVREIIGVGEVALSDHRSRGPGLPELARLVTEAHVAGMLAGKAGTTHLHIGDGPSRLAPLRALLDSPDHAVDPAWLYPTHVERTEALMREAVDLARRGSWVDVDTVEEDLPRWLGFYLAHGGDPARLTASSDAAITSPMNLFRQVRSAVLEHGFPLDLVLTCVTVNPAAACRLGRKGTLAPGRDADVLVLDRDSLEIVHVYARGRAMVRDSALIAAEGWEAGSNRRPGRP
jgi:beta-aspartyl-dipeptidase (metallo-type)